MLSSVVPYAADLIALRRVPTQFFGLFMSINPVLAALAGIALLDQQPTAHEWIGVAIVVAVNAVAVTVAGRQSRDTPGLRDGAGGRHARGENADTVSGAA